MQVYPNSFGLQKSNPKWQGNNLPQYPLLIKIRDQVPKLSQKFKHHKPSKIRGSGIIFQPCNSLLARDRSGSTKSMREHLFCKYKLIDPGKVESGLKYISVMIKKEKTNHVSKFSIFCKGLTLKSLKKAITYLIANTDLVPVAFFEHKSFRELMNLVNPELGFNRCGHWHSSSSHTGSNFAKVFIEVLDNYNLTDFLVGITVDNASKNSSLAARVEQILDGQFMASEHLLGCMAHVINLDAKYGLQSFRFKTNTPDSELTLEKMNNPMHKSHHQPTRQSQR
ncbi:uncharacterized protein VP01_463g10 [Puccinia sorghi]|uniref:DUF659 domain-containing protein n=1 Tax=Puccinia sorghi TaxID=27349 RepID=A0A0L6UP49_9BASI|nr:uncharacterized protein VP01_463g10 [Puccinia sorghi]